MSAAGGGPAGVAIPQSRTIALGVIGGLVGIYLVPFVGPVAGTLTALPAYAAVGGSVSLGAATLAGIFALGVFFINAVVASYNIGGTIEGFHDPKFKRLPRGVLACLVVSLVSAIVGLLLVGGI
jgi:tetrahydromethanopterin S-methyltransferase subunit D